MAATLRYERFLPSHGASYLLTFPDALGLKLRIQRHGLGREKPGRRLTHQYDYKTFLHMFVCAVSFNLFNPSGCFGRRTL